GTGLNVKLPAASVTARNVCSIPSTVIVTPANGLFTALLPVSGPGTNSDAYTVPITAVPASGVRLSVSNEMTFNPKGVPVPAGSSGRPSASFKPAPSKNTETRVLPGNGSR